MADFSNLIAGMHIGRLLPEILVLVVAGAAILTDVILPRGRSTRAVQLVTLLGLIVVIAASFLQRADKGQAFLNMVSIDGFTFYFRVILAGITFLVVAVSERYLDLARIRIAEYYLMLLFSLFGMMLMAMANDLLIVFLGIETMSVSLYALVGMSRHKLASSEGALKYFLLGAFTTGFFLYGIALLFGAAGSTNLTEIAAYLHAAKGDLPLIAWAGAGLVLVAFGFKTALVPFHWWSPDAYEGAPTTITAFMSTAPKAAAFAAFLRVFYVGFADLVGGWEPVLWWIAVITMTFGNLLALQQDSVKRMLAFSSITHAGYLVVALLTFDSVGAAAVLFYLVVYALMNVGAFLVAIAINRNEDDEKGYAFEDYRGLGFRRPGMALAMLIFMLSLAGIPPTAGFFGKYYIFSAAVKQGYVTLAVIGVINSLFSVYYYMRVIVMMYLKEREEESEGRLFWTGEMAQTVFLCALLILLVGLFPDRLLEVARASVAALM
ncbi:MAG TPA: NADH-quinone oxidoreductase subunit N [Bacteroidetes bacterium]|nr:NADH-quinone oxidoreductase subunit N [Bacteroidota bacterium]